MGPCFYNEGRLSSTEKKVGRRGAADFNRGESSFCSLLQRISRSSVRTGVFLEQPGCKWVAHGSAKRGIGEKKFSREFSSLDLVKWDSSETRKCKTWNWPGIVLELSWNDPGNDREWAWNRAKNWNCPGIVLEWTGNAPGKRLEEARCQHGAGSKPGRGNSWEMAWDWLGMGAAGPEPKPGMQQE